MSFTDVFGGETLYPSGQTYLSLIFSVDQTLAWPIEQQVGGNVVSSIMDLNATATGLSVNIPDARQVSNGMQSIFNNVGSNTITIKDNAGGTIISLAAAEAWVVYLTDNSTAAGTWRTFQLGASVSVANASALAGAGLKAIATTLNQTIPPTLTAVTPVTLVDADRARLTIWTGGVGILNLPTPGTVGSDWFVLVRNGGSGDLTVTPAAGNIDGSVTLAMSAGQSAIITTDGNNYFTVGLGTSSTSIFDFISIAVPGTGDYTLSGAELNRISYRFTGILTGNRNIIVPGAVEQYWIDNQTTGAFSLFVKTAPQVGPPEVLQGDRNIFYCDGTDVVDAESSTVTFPIVISQGGTNATTAAAARTNLGVPPSTRLITAGGGLIGGGDLSSDRTIDIVGTVGILVNANDIALDTANTRNVDHTAVSITAGLGLTGGGAIDATRTLDVGAGTGILANANDVALDTANTRNVDHSTVSVTAGVGLIGGGTIASTRTIDLDISALPALAGTDVAATDGMLVDDAGVMKRIAYQSGGLPIIIETTTARTLVDADMNSVIRTTNGAAVSIVLNSGVGEKGNMLVVVQDAAGQVTLSGTATLNNANGLKTAVEDAVIVLLCLATDLWVVYGDTVV